MTEINVNLSRDEAKLLLEKTYPEWKRLNKTRQYILDKWGDVSSWPHNERLSMIESFRLKITLDKFNGSE